MIKFFDENNKIYILINNLTSRLNIEIVEINFFRKRNKGRISVVLYKSNGLSTDTLSDLHKIILLILESRFQYDFNFTLELSTPGIDRKIKSDREFKIFEGKKIKLMLGNDFEEGFILKSFPKGFIFKTNNKEVNVFFRAVKKARLV